MSQYHGSVSLRDTQRNKQQEQRDTDDNIAIQNRDIINKTDYLARTGTQIEYADGSDTPNKVETVAAISAMVNVLISALVSE